MTRRSISAHDLETVMSAILDAAGTLEPGLIFTVHACPHGVVIGVDDETVPPPCPICGANVNIRVYLRGFPPEHIIRTLGGQ